MIINALDSMISAPFGLIYMIILTDEWRFSKKTMRLLAPLFVLCLFIADISIFWRIGVTVEGRALISIINIISCGIFYLIVYKYLDGRLIFIFFSACLFIFISDTISDCVFYYTDIIHLCIKTTVFLVIGVLLYKIFRRPFLEVIQEIKHEWWWFTIIPLSLSFTFALIIMVPGPLYQHPELQPQAILMCLSVFCVYVAFYMFFRKLKDHYRMEGNYQLLKVQVSSLKNHADTLSAMDGQLKMYRHDIRHYMHVIHTCVESHDWDSVNQVLESMSRSLNSYDGSGELKVYSGDPIIDATLSFFSERVKDEKIELDVYLESVPDKAADITEFSVMLSNAIENAYNACMQMPDGQKRIIRVNGRCEGAQYLLEIANTYAGTVVFDSKGMPTAAREGHGYGTRSIESFVQRCKGYLDFDARDGWFRMRMIL
ncbi:sensor histidine kinase [Extibacter muris]|uniref:sensor histidine kinase n=1 Tax=Extibacter muris TaxID=1796622 RepID=UPI001D067871|nr:GHKL domain-containing protein [Extibacter muris]MCB6203425.1 GHKL domain-containing protein [Extibacter muris]MCQ4665001.1 GHKL domain-containing protein [Extibacter muris]MCQ4694366.1 GHKL domain-containing protein [Extibacter muris]